jgi:hypothetical protein
LLLAWSREAHPAAWRQLGVEVCAAGFDTAEVCSGEIGDAIVSVFFPAGCRISDRLLTSASRVPLCAQCLASFERLPGILCKVCGRPLPGIEHKPDQPLLCPACQEKTYAFERGAQLSIV